MNFNLWKSKTYSRLISDYRYQFEQRWNSNNADFWEQLEARRVVWFQYFCWFETGRARRWTVKPNHLNMTLNYILLDNRLTNYLGFFIWTFMLKTMTRELSQSSGAVRMTYWNNLIEIPLGLYMSSNICLPVSKLNWRMLSCSLCLLWLVISYCHFRFFESKESGFLTIACAVSIFVTNTTVLFCNCADIKPILETVCLYRKPSFSLISKDEIWLTIFVCEIHLQR